ncbi:MAG: transglutaminase [Candidatus Bathyarchaeota archaeon B26-2]|nr:MAG: transglutaminase [Candidatus Bathyarchaeota archaeon B26-2]
MRIAKYKRTIAAAVLSVILIGATSTYYLVFPPLKVPQALFRYTETITVENRGTGSIKFGGISTEGFLNLAWQRARLIEVSGKYTISKDGDGNPIIVVEGPETLSRGESYTVTIVWEIESFNRPKPIISLENAGGLESIPDSLRNYTREVAPWWSPPDIRLDTDAWNKTRYYNMSLSEVASTLAGNETRVLKIVLEDVKWIATHITYHSASPTYPVETARNRTGDCDDQSNLLIALLRMQGIPSFLMMGMIYLRQEAYANRSGVVMGGHQYNEYHHVIGHGWAMVYIPPWGWLPCDLTSSYSIELRNDPKKAITEAVLWNPATLVFRNATGIGGAEASDYIGSLRETEAEAKEKNIYYKLILDLEHLAVPEHEVILRSPAFVIYSEIICAIALIILVGAHERGRKTPPVYLGAKKCTYCGSENPADAIYCGWCGRRLLQRPAE